MSRGWQKVGFNICIQQQPCMCLCNVKMSLQGKGRVIKPPSEEDFQNIKLISNGAYG